MGKHSTKEVRPLNVYKGKGKGINNAKRYMGDYEAVQLLYYKLQKKRGIIMKNKKPVAVIMTRG